MGIVRISWGFVLSREGGAMMEILMKTQLLYGLPMLKVFDTFNLDFIIIFHCPFLKKLNLEIRKFITFSLCNLADIMTFLSL